MKKIMMCLLCFCLIIGYFIYISYFYIDVTSYDVYSDKLKGDMNIVMIADVHDKHCYIMDDVIQKVNSLHPDAILCVGDMIDDEYHDDETMISFLKKLVDISDVYMSLGNQEMSYYERDPNIIKDIKDTGVHLLEYDYADIQINGESIRIGGMYDYAFGYDGNISQESMKNNMTYRFLSQMCETSSFKLMMAHRPDSFIFGEAYQWDIDLLVSGHYHGGQVVIPFIGGLYAPDLGYFPKYDYGFFYLKNINMIITRGIASGGEYLPRINNPAEIVNIHLHSSES